AYNRYSYVLNNPTNLTDPTGFAPLVSCAGTRTGDASVCPEAFLERTAKEFNQLGMQDKARVIANVGIGTVNTVLSAAGFQKIDAKNLTAAGAAQLFARIDGELSEKLLALPQVARDDMQGWQQR